MTTNPDTSGLWSQLSPDKSKQRGFPATTGTHNGDDLAAGNIDGNFVKNTPLPTPENYFF